jgi:hypothetical protein
MIRAWMRTAALAALIVSAQAVSAADFSGKWIFDFNTPDGVVSAPVELTQEGESLTATITNQKLAGHVREDSFDLAGDYFHADSGYTAPLKIEGKMQGEGLAGNASWDANQLTFTAKRAQ